MAGETATLALEGDVDLAAFTAALDSFRMVLDGLAEVEAAAVGQRIAWEIAALDHGSAITTVRGVADDREAVLAVTAGLEAIGAALENKQALPYGGTIGRAVSDLTQLANGRVRAIRLLTNGRDYVLA